MNERVPLHWVNVAGLLLFLISELLALVFGLNGFWLTALIWVAGCPGWFLLWMAPIRRDK